MTKVTGFTTRLIAGKTYRMPHMTAALVDEMQKTLEFYITENQKLADTIIEWHFQKYQKMAEEAEKTGKFKSPAEMACDLLTDIGKIIHKVEDTPKTGLYLPGHLVDNPKGKIELTDLKK